MYLPVEVDRTSLSMRKFNVKQAFRVRAQSHIGAPHLPTSLRILILGRTTLGSRIVNAVRYQQNTPELSKTSAIQVTILTPCSVKS